MRIDVRPGLLFNGEVNGYELWNVRRYLGMAALKNVMTVGRAFVSTSRSGKLFCVITNVDEEFVYVTMISAMSDNPASGDSKILISYFLNEWRPIREVDF